MFKMLTSLTKATVGAIVEVPVAIATDVVTLGGRITERNEPHTTEALKKVIDNVKDSTK